MANKYSQALAEIKDAVNVQEGDPFIEVPPTDLEVAEFLRGLSRRDKIIAASLVFLAMVDFNVDPNVIRVED